MPETTLQQRGTTRKLDARPDRIDYRDREFQPALVSLPAVYPTPEIVKQYLPVYSRKLILDQGSEGACTGFGLAATINYLRFRAHVRQHGVESVADLECVSPRMLYQLARIYDEWPGEDYAGSSCRGAMKGWHRHGVCTEKIWPYRYRGRVQFVRPTTGWQQDAASRPLGAYYRINKDSIADMQAAINEVGAIYVSSMVHRGWMLRKSNQLPVIGFRDTQTGGHAFALVGYNAQGFIVQNSWGPNWGYFGFAVMTYQDWVQHGRDAWVAVLGAPMQVAEPSRSFSSMRLEDVDSGRANWFWQRDRAASATRYRNEEVEPLSESDAYEHTVVLGNDGRPLNRYIDVAIAAAAVREAALTNPERWLTANRSTKLAIYAHGGLNDESDSIKRIRVMAPYFRENGIYPLFVTWKTGFRETIGGMLEDVVIQFLAGRRDVPDRGWFDDLRRQIREARDRAIEVACEQVLVKSVWVQMKQNAETAARGGSGLHLLANELATLKKRIPNLDIHLVGHSAGSILLGHLLDRFAGKKLTADTCTLYAPACTVEFALRHYGRAHDKRVLSKRQLYCDIMSDERERADSVGPYGKSLLYLVSRALEEVHKMPLLGMEAAWSERAETPDVWNGDTLRDVEKWRDFVRGTNGLKVHKQKMISDGRGEIALAHGSFDNDVKVVTATLQRIRGRKIRTKVESLRGF
jgi:hypothetical protein